ncbi:MAG: hypothetical protein GY850_02550 [bacterium]|nr:hypothetical protein [bacterium]
MVDFQDLHGTSSLYPRKLIGISRKQIAKKNNIKIQFVRKNNFRKEKRIKEIIYQRGYHPGLVHVFSAMESCTAYKPWHDKKSHKTFFKYDSGWCLHYYFYFIDKDFGLCYLRVPPWAPFRLQFYCNDISFFKHHRKVEHRDGTSSYKVANMRKTIFSIPQLIPVMSGCNRRYIEFLSAVDDPTNGI